MKNIFATIVIYTISMHLCNAQSVDGSKQLSNRDSLAKVKIERTAKYAREMQEKADAIATKANDDKMKAFYESDEGKKMLLMAANEQKVAKEAEQKKIVDKKKLEEARSQVVSDSIYNEAMAIKQAKIAKMMLAEKKDGNKIVDTKQGVLMPASSMLDNAKNEYSETEKILAEKKRIQTMMHPNEQELIVLSRANKLVANEVLNKKYELVTYRQQPPLNNDKIVFHFSDEKFLNIHFNNTKAQGRYHFPNHNCRVYLDKLMDRDGTSIESQMYDSFADVFFASFNKKGLLVMCDEFGYELFELKQVK